MSEFNAKVKKHGITFAETNDNIIFWMELELPHGGGVGFVTSASTAEGDNNFAHSISEVMKVLDVTNLDDIDGRPLIAVFDGEMFIGSKLIGIKHFLDKGSFMLEK